MAVTVVPSSSSRRSPEPASTQAGGLRALLLLGRGRSRRVVRGRPRTICGRLRHLGGGELEVGPTCVTWISTVWRLLPTLSCQLRWTSLPGDEDSHAFLQTLRCVLGDRSPCRAAKEPVVDVPLTVTSIRTTSVLLRRLRRRSGRAVVAPTLSLHRRGRRPGIDMRQLSVRYRSRLDPAASLDGKTAVDQGRHWKDLMERCGLCRPFTL